MNLHLPILTALLQKLKQPYTVDGNVLIVTPTSSPLLEILPGEWIDEDDTTSKRIDLDSFDVIEYMAEIINSLAKIV
jgi:hypothetical protein